MTEFITTYYLWIKAFHLISVFAWMAGLFYLPRLFVYHTQAVSGSDIDNTFKIMEARLLKIIMNPAMSFAWVFGILLIFYHIEDGTMKSGWLHLKLTMVIALTIFHKLCIFHARKFANNQNQKSGRYFRILNEIPTLAMVVIVICVVVQPF